MSIVFVREVSVVMNLDILGFNRKCHVPCLIANKQYLSSVWYFMHGNNVSTCPLLNNESAMCTADQMSNK